MQKKYSIIAVDDNPDTLKPVLMAVQRMLQNDQIEIEYEILSKRKDVDKLKDRPCDVVMFDCALSGEDYSFQNYEASRFGLELLQEYRKNNRRTKIIFYSGAFDFEGEGHFDLTTLDFVKMINELNVFAISNRSVGRLSKSVKNAIKELDTVLISLEELIYKYGEDGTFWVDGQQIGAQDLLKELHLGTQLGEKFREEINSTIISYFMKFGGC